jgi:hypothetical protein
MPHPFKEANLVMLSCQGRSGSTLLMRLLNEIEGYSIMGENRGCVKQLVSFYKNIKYMNAVRETVREEHFKMAWNNRFDLNQVINDIYNLFSDLFWDPTNRVFGFKEISFGHETSDKGAYEKFEWEMDLFRELFPNLKIVFLTRDINELLKSDWWADNVDESRDILQRQERNFIQYYQKKGAENCSFLYFLTYSDLVGKSANLLGLYDFLAEPFDEAKYQLVISKKTK